MYLIIIILPLLAAIFAGFFGRNLGTRGAQIITTSSIVITTVLAILAFIEVGYNNSPLAIHLMRWIDSESLNVSWGFYYDSLTVSMLLPVLIVSSLVHLYSISYMSHDPHNQRFFSYLSLFTFMMIILVTANNYLLMFLGWEGVGICSYLLINFWFTRIAANQSSISAFLTNRVGDCCLMIGMFILPTPVSALIHAATMVTAGVYLLMRSSPLIEYSSTVLLICLWIGAITTLFSSLIGLFQPDIKKVIAYSTMSQLGMMVIAIGLSSYNLALFHLINHAFYKALLFLGAGAIIHSVADNQDFRKFGGLKPFLPLTYSAILIASLSLVAIPFMTGFYSKDFILESSYGQYYLSSIIVYFLATIGAMFTTLYSVKIIYLTFLGNPQGNLQTYKHSQEGNLWLNLPLIILAIFSIFFGYLTKDLFIGIASGLFSDNSLFIHPLHECLLDTEFALPTLFKLLPFILTLSLSILALIFSEFFSLYLINFKYTKLGYNLFGFFNQKLLLELFYNNYITNTVLSLGSHTTKILDKGSVEFLGPYGLERSLLALSNNIGLLNTGVITSYGLYILIGFLSYISLFYFNSINNSLLLLLLFSTFILFNKN
uniref:NADH-ubiquinone oxidoreductase chain 5 n=1 Tax=Paracoccidioides brasiliensis (strain Pb18) TaxID=502780 RepID=Q1XAA6_PARBD|nr:NAHD dehydrogenase subunit 5 [Paracoccidioides brasiliensis]AAY30339.1 NAHD dehydrogenase subunit 5 [Paracoccidioides brasiliensis]